MISVFIIENPLVKVDVTNLRNKSTNEELFRNSVKRISYALAIEISNYFNVKEINVETPLEMAIGHELTHSIVLVPILRAGLGMMEAFLEIMPQASVGHIGLQRDEETLQPIDYYYKTPKQLDKAKVILLDPMLATGGSSSAAISYLKKSGAKECYFASLISTPEGIKKVTTDHTDIKIFTAALDRGLNEKGYIVPGLGDAGDRTFGTL